MSIELLDSPERRVHYPRTMRRFLYLFIGGSVAAGSLAGCQRPAPSGGDNSDVITKLDDISKKLDEIEKKVEKSGAAAKPQRPKRPRPDAKATYSVPVGDSPYVGPEHAKVTIVEAFEYA